MKILEFGPESAKGAKKIYKFHKKLYKNNSTWVSLLKMQLLGNKLLGEKGLLRSNHPFFEHAEARYFIAVDEKGKTLGTIASIVNHRHNEFNKDKTGFFGFFEVIEDYDVAKELLDKAKAWLKSKGMNVMRGPSNFSTNETVGLLIENYEDVPFLGTTYNPPYYKDFLEKYNMTKAMDILAEMLPVKMSDSESEQKRTNRMLRVANKIKDRFEIKTESFNRKNPEKHLSEIKSLYMQAWKDNWGFVPVTDKEFDILAHNLIMVSDPDLIRIAYIKGEAVAFIGSLPDLNEVLHKSKKWPELSKMLRMLWWLKRRKYTRIRLLLFGIGEEYRKMGLDAILFAEGFKIAQDRGYEECEISWLLETNKLVIAAGIKLSAKIYKKWRFYETPIEK